MPTITYREVRDWPGEKTPSCRRTRAGFKAHATRLWNLLDRELVKVNAKDITLSGYWRARDFKRDGGVYADARPVEPGVILEFVRGKDRLMFSADKFLAWLDNVDAIGRSLEALRMVDRYGVLRGQQYEGFKALPSSTLTSAELAGIIVAAANMPSDTRVSVDVVRRARNNAHPDRGGSAQLFSAVTDAATRLGF